MSCPAQSCIALYHTVVLYCTTLYYRQRVDPHQQPADRGPVGCRQQGDGKRPEGEKDVDGEEHDCHGGMDLKCSTQPRLKSDHRVGQAGNGTEGGGRGGGGGDRNRGVSLSDFCGWGSSGCGGGVEMGCCEGRCWYGWLERLCVVWMREHLGRSEGPDGAACAPQPERDGQDLRHSEKELRTAAQKQTDHPEVSTEHECSGMATCQLGVATTMMAWPANRRLGSVTARARVQTAVRCTRASQGLLRARRIRQCVWTT